jgi:large subunit ribosomal protein L6
VQTTLATGDGTTIPKLHVSVRDTSIAHQRSMWGTMQSLLSNSIAGVSEGHVAILRLVGVGYRATIEETATTISSEFPGQKFVNLKLGFAHPVELGVPKGVKASTPQPTRILLEGSDKQEVNLFAAKIRMWRKPEPYKGKGIFVNDETIRLKSKNIK